MVVFTVRGRGGRWMDVKRWQILYMRAYIYGTNWLGRGIRLLYYSWRIFLLVLYIYMHTYISTLAKLFPWIYQVYQHQLTQNNHSNWTHIPGIHYFQLDISPLISLTKSYEYTDSNCVHDQCMKRNLSPFFPLFELTINIVRSIKLFVE